MSLKFSNALFFCRKKPHFKNSCFSESLHTALGRVTSTKHVSVLCFEERRERIAKLIHEPELSISTYDTAWVAMVPSPNSSHEPYFPDCVNWLLENQCQNGSWARPHHHRLLQKDVLSSTLACILALKKWGVGEEQITRGKQFIELNFGSATEDHQFSPVGFEVIFPSMLEYARDLSLDLNLEPTIFNNFIRTKNLELKRCNESQIVEMEAHMAYLSEGMGNLKDLKSVMKYQRKNGSLFNSPSTTAAVSIFHHNAKCLDYLQSALEKFGNAVPTIYPLKIYTQLRTIDNLQQLGISRYFRKEIESVLNEIYSCWLQGDEEIFMDGSTCFLAFKILRMNGYDVTSDWITKLIEEESFPDSLDGSPRNINRILESYKASEIIFPNEAAFEKQNLRLKDLLEQELSSNSDRLIVQEVCSPNFGSKDFYFMSVEDFNECQNLHREELKELERWVIENRLDELKFARSKSAYCYFSAAATLFSPDLSDARMSWAKNGVLTTVVDDFFDVGGSVDELKNLIQLVEEWDVNASTECSSQNVQIIFSALKSTISEIGDKAFIRQERSVTKHIIKIWLDLLNSMLKETEWARERTVITMDEYMSNAYISFALGPIVLPALYLIGPKVSEEMVHHSEYHNLFQLMSTCGRLLNDIRGYERELKDGKLSAVSLYIINNGGDITEETAVEEIKRWTEGLRRELHTLVLDGKNSVLPRACKDLFWYMSTILHLFYFKDDGFSSQELIKVVNQIIYNPIVLKES
ncbi:hypothetical protein RD792_002643 [Penstemon davidsonii]|uniref:Ent-kaurene synthase n=1 Tax=Penstemon davidsonii TaxID=160366 RepID=A0ABR0DS12_9LAMI|nr:hypothetical protein RD792_002643 [Penstemon davidsonii]